MANPIPVIKFHKRKYGDELLVDVVTLDTIRNSKTFAPVQRQSFYGLMLTTGGEGDVEVDGVPAVACKGMVACARPGDVCTIIEDRGLLEETTQKTTQKMIELMRSNPTITIESLCKECGLTRDGVNWNIRKLKSAGLIRRIGPDKGGHWEVVEENLRRTAVKQ